MRTCLRPLRATGVSALLALSVGCGGEDRGRPSTIEPLEVPSDPAAAPPLCDVDPKLELVMIDDFEHGTANAAWYTNNDVCETCQDLLNDINLIDRLAWCDDPLRPELGTEPACLDPANQPFLPISLGGDGTNLRDDRKDKLAVCSPPCRAIQFPSLFDKPLPAEVIPGTRCGSRYALHIRGGPFLDWGGNAGMNFSPPVDASTFEGVALWARRGGAGRNPLRFEVSERHTDQNYDQGNGEPLCQPDTNDDNSFLGCDKWGAHVVLDDNWHMYLLPFEEFRQGGWGRTAPFLDVWGLMSISVQFVAGYWDFWIDDIAFYRRKP
jgi:hypothetical protein